MLFSVSQNDGTDFLKNAITYGQTEGFASELWRGDDVSIGFFRYCAVENKTTLEMTLTFLVCNECKTQTKMMVSILNEKLLCTMAHSARSFKFPFVFLFSA